MPGSESKVELVEFKDDKGLNQIYSSGFELALCKRKGKSKNVFVQIHPYVFCKDYLHDMVWATIHNVKYSIYGLSYDPNALIEGIDSKVTLESTILAVRDKDVATEEMKKRVNKSIEFINKINDICKFEKTETFDAPGAFITEGDKRWMHSPPLLSLYTLFLRLGCNYKKGDPVGFIMEAAESGTFRDSSYTKAIVDNKLIPEILERNTAMFNKKMEDNYPASVANYDLHNRFGIVNFSTTFACGQPVVKGWYTQKDKGEKK